MAVPNLFWRNVEVVNAPPPLYLIFYRKLAMIAKPIMKLAMIAKPNIERVVDGYRNS